MFRKTIGLIVILFCLTVTGWGIDHLTLTGGMRVSPILEKNEVFLKRIDDAVADWPDFYVLSTQYGIIYRFNLESGKLINTISSKGQGPKELMQPISIIVRDGRIYVLDNGFLGVKIFKIDGELLGSFRMKNPVWGGSLTVGMAMNTKGELYIASPDLVQGHLIAVYNPESGLRKHSLVSEPDLVGKRFDKGLDESLMMAMRCSIALDGQDRLYVMHPLRRELVQYDAEGRELWRRRIDLLDERLNAMSQSPDITRNKDRPGFGTNQKIWGFTAFRNGNVLIRHIGGSLVIGSDGSTLRLVDTQFGLGTLRYNNDTLVAVGTITMEEDSPMLALFRHVDRQINLN